jgi:hypothetical protein
MSLATRQLPMISIDGPPKRGGFFDDRVHWELRVRLSAASLARTLKALIYAGGKLHDTLVWGHNTEATLLISLAPEVEEQFRRDARPVSLEYRSPDRFDNGTLYPIYKTPLEEVEAKRQAAIARLRENT